MKLLESVKIERFRGIREGAIEGLEQVNVLVGRNNSGKSTVAEAIIRASSYMAAGEGGKLDDTLGRPRHRFWQINRQEPKNPNQLWFRGETTHNVLIKLQSESNAGSYVISGDIEEGARGALSVDLVSGATAFLPSMGHQSGDEKKLWPALLLPRADKKLTRAMSDIFEMPALEAIQQLPDGILWLLFEDFSVPLDSQGDGARSVLRCLMPLALLENTLYIIEEPEVHQHAGALGRFAKAVCELGKERNVQLIITTHSLECVNAFLDGADLSQSTSALFHLSLEDGKLGARKLTADEVRSLTDLGTDVRKLDLYA